MKVVGREQGVGRNGLRLNKFSNRDCANAQPAEYQRLRKVYRTAFSRAVGCARRSKPHRPTASETINGTAYSKRAAIDDVRVHHRRAHVRVAQEFLHRLNVVAVLDATEV